MNSSDLGTYSCSTASTEQHSMPGLPSRKKRSDRTALVKKGDKETSRPLLVAPGYKDGKVPVSFSITSKKWSHADKKLLNNSICPWKNSIFVNIRVL
jgi:hypothetical protein